MVQQDSLQIRQYTLHLRKTALGASMLAAAFGPTISGWLLQNFAWEWLFIMNIPICLIAIVLVAAYIPFYRQRIAYVHHSLDDGSEPGG